ncbi:Insulin receptor substrate 2-A [Trichinella spiralis]|uniref:Insulin receptor substrate 1 n=2 Tax=Trichinella spiralis TaxID=6334 RepID=A0A0V1C263_TRISP|nr:Insulin receptor substrate 2-A [Trichinella spiralis]
MDPLILFNESNVPDDIIKMGILRKGKRARKRFFVLHQDSYNGPARLECFDNEKRYRCHAAPKLSIPLKTCFNINKKVDSKLKFCIAMYTIDDYLLLGCENELDQDAWLHTLLEVLMNTKMTGLSDDLRRANFEYVWQVKVLKNRGLTEKVSKLAGLFRFCLNTCSVYFYKLNTDEEFFEFPLVYISNYGHQGNLFFLRVGRSAVTGPGELWMNTEDVVDAGSMHETMKIILEDNHEQRQRNMPIEPRGLRSDSQNSTRSNSISVTTTLPPEALMHSDLRSRAISENEKTLQKRCRPRMKIKAIVDAIANPTKVLRSHLNYLQHRSHSGVSSKLEYLANLNCYSCGAPPSYSRSASHSPSVLHNRSGYHGSALATSPVIGLSNDSFGSISNSSDFDHFANGLRYSHRQHVGNPSLELISRSTIVEESSGGSGTDCVPFCKTSKGILELNDENSFRPARTLITHCVDVHSSPDCVESFRRMTLDSGCVDPVSPRRDADAMSSSYSSEQISDYIPMAPGTTTALSNAVTDSWRLEDIRPTIGPDLVTAVPPLRAYSCGSKPTVRNYGSVKQPSWMRKLQHFSFNDERKRAHSFGNWKSAKLMSLRKHSAQQGSDLGESGGLRQRSGSFGSDRSSGNSFKHQLPGRIFDSKFSSGSEDLVEIDFGAFPYGRSNSGSFGSGDSLNRSRASSAGTASIYRQSWSPKIEQISEQELSPSAKLIQDLIFTRRCRPSLERLAEYVPMSPPVANVNDDTVSGKGSTSMFSSAEGDHVDVNDVEEDDDETDIMRVTREKKGLGSFRIRPVSDEITFSPDIDSSLDILQGVDRMMHSDISSFGRGNSAANATTVPLAAASLEQRLRFQRPMSSCKWSAAPRCSIRRRHSIGDPCGSIYEELKRRKKERFFHSDMNFITKFPLSECCKSISLLKRIGRRSLPADFSFQCFSRSPYSSHADKSRLKMVTTHTSNNSNNGNTNNINNAEDDYLMLEPVSQFNVGTVVQRLFFLISMSAIHRALFLWSCIMAFVIIAVMRLDGRISWHWSAVFTPLWILDLVALFYTLLSCVRQVHLLRACSLGFAQIASDGYCKRRNVSFLLVILFKLCFLSLLSVKLEQQQHQHSAVGKFSTGESIKFWHVMLPFWASVSIALAEITYRLYHIYKCEM